MESYRKAPEGKTLAEPGKTCKCDNCDALNGQYYCKECNFVYCPVCEKGHKRNKFTDHHQSTPIADISVSNLEGKMSAMNLGTCKRHNKTITSTCHTCTTVICDDCKTSHSGHDVQPCTNDGRITQKICRSQTQSLYDALEMTENTQDCSRKRKSLCEHIRKKIRETVTLIKDEATKLGKSIEKDLDEIERDGDGKEKEVAAYAKKVDTKIARLTSIRNITDATVLVPEAAETAGILDELVDIQNMAADLNTKDATVWDVLPNLGNVNQVLDDMKQALEMNTKFKKQGKSGMVDAKCWSHVSRDSRSAVNYKYDMIRKLEATSIKNTQTNNHKICDCARDNREHLIFHGRDKRDIHKFNIKTGQTKTTTCEYEIWSMVETSVGEYVAVDESASNLLLLDNTFKVKHTLFEHDTIQALCYLCPKTFLMLQNKGFPNTATLTEVQVNSNRFEKKRKVVVKTDDNPLFIRTMSKSDNVCMVATNHMYIVNMVNSAIETYDISRDFNGASCASMYVDESDNTLVGDYENALHVFYSGMKHSVAAKLDGKIYGITTIDDILYVTAGGQISKYRIG